MSSLSSPVVTFSCDFFIFIKTGFSKPLGLGKILMLKDLLHSSVSKLQLAHGPAKIGNCYLYNSLSVLLHLQRLAFPASGNGFAALSQWEEKFRLAVICRPIITCYQTIIYCGKKKKKKWEGEENVFHKIIFMILFIYCMDYITGLILKRGSVLCKLWFTAICQSNYKKSVKPTRANQYVTT